MESNGKGKRNKAKKHPIFFQRELMKELTRISLSFYILESWGIVKGVERFEGLPSYCQNFI